MESAESKIGPWLDASRDQNSESFVYFSEEHNDPDYVKRMRAILEINSSSSDSEESYTNKVKNENTCTRCS